ncbi:MAG TPA: hypothetical protein VFQ92_18040 [Blastocatellia bacterium]|nr:hypothetical protein [Blastocatellia bacterium]
MGTRKRTDITFETREVLIIKGGGLGIAWCAGCGQKVRVIRLLEADLKNLSGEPPSTEALHFVEASACAAAICLPSLLKRVSLQELPLHFRKEML